MKAFVLISLFFSVAFGQLTAKVEEVVKKDKDKTYITADNKEAKVGMSAIVIRTVSTGDELVGYKCETTKKEEENLELECSVHNGFEQEAMPTIYFDIKKGDKVVFSPLGKRAAIFAPTQNVYIQTKNMLKGYEFVSSDLLAAPLFSDDNPFPQKEEFNKFCENYLVGSLVFGFTNKTTVVDCSTFAVIEEIPNSFTIDKKERVMPFFHRLEKIETGFWDWFGDEEIKSFDTYYKGLIDAK